MDFKYIIKPLLFQFTIKHYIMHFCLQFLLKLLYNDWVESSIAIIGGYVILQILYSFCHIIDTFNACNGHNVGQWLMFNKILTKAFFYRYTQVCCDLNKTSYPYSVLIFTKILLTHTALSITRLGHLDIISFQSQPFQFYRSLCILPLFSQAACTCKKKTNKLINRTVKHISMGHLPAYCIM